jgi:hypothetical protein
LEKIAFRYIGILAGTVFLFVNFIACGAQMYQVSMEKDFASERMTPQASDPKSPEYGIHAIGGWSKLPIKFETSAELTANQRAGLVSAMKSWELAVGRRLFVYGGDDNRAGDSFNDLYSSLHDKVNGHYLDDNWAKTGKPDAVLATTIWDNTDPSTIATADIRFNSNHYTIYDSLDSENLKLTSLDPAKEVVDMESLSLHELGHLLGLAHMDAEKDQYSIMNPSLFIGAGLANRKLSQGDITRIQRIYGCEGESCNIEKLMLALEQNQKAKPAKGASPQSRSATSIQEGAGR